MRKNVKIGVAVVAIMYGMGSTIFFGGTYLKQKQAIGEQIQYIEQLQNSYEWETDRAANLEVEIKELNATVDSARRDISELEADIERDKAEIRELEIVQEEERVRASRSGFSYSGGREITVKVTGYCPCSYCCGVWATLNPGITASGTVAKFGTIAAPSSLPFGTQMYIEGYGDQIFTVEDTGSAVVYSDGVYVIDMWMPTHEQAYNVGNSIVRATVIN